MMGAKTSEQPAKAAKKTVAKRAAAKKTVVRKTMVKKAVAKKSAAAKSAMKNAAAKRPAARRAAAPEQAPTSRSGGTARPALLSGDNPQIPKGYGSAPVKAYIAAIPGWKRAVARRLDALVARTVPGVHKAVKWNTPLYGMDDESWFLAMHCFTRYLKVTFFRGTSLKPVPPVASKTPYTRYFHIHEDDAFDDAQLAAWIRQASALPGERM
jgi:hypothetical protein